MSKDTSHVRLKRFGSLLVDTDAIIAIAPIFADGDTEGATAHGFRVITTSGTLDVIDKPSGDAIYAYFTPQEPGSVS